MSYVKHKGMDIYYDVKGSGVPLLCIHPPAMSHLTFRYQQEVSKWCQLIVIDLPGNGYSLEATTEALSISEEAACIRAVLDDLRVTKAVILGYSNGGSVAQEFALQFPERTSGLILIGGFPEVSSILLRKEFELGMWASSRQLVPLISKVLPKAHFTDKQHQKEMEGLISRVQPSYLLGTYEYGLAYQSTERLSELAAPLLLIYGQNDRITNGYMYIFAKHVPDLEIVLIEGVAHQVPTKTPRECNQVIIKWLKQKSLLD